MRLRACSLAWLAGMLWSITCAAQPALVVDLPTRPGITQRMLVIAADQPTATLVLLTGGAGHLGIFDNGSMRNDGNFLVRSRSLFAGHGYAVLVLDTPSDRSRPPFMDGSFRESPENAADIGAAIAWGRQRFGRPVWLVGTSRGTQSATHAATVLTGAQAPDGLVLTSSILAAGRSSRFTARAVQDMALDRLRLPVLVAHHERDECEACPPSRLPALMARLQPGSSRLLMYSGGRSVGPACEALAWHGFNDIEAKVVDDIAAFVAAPGPTR